MPKLPHSAFDLTRRPSQKHFVTLEKDSDRLSIGIFSAFVFGSYYLCLLSQPVFSWRKEMTFSVLIPSRLQLDA